MTFDDIRRAILALSPDDTSKIATVIFDQYFQENSSAHSWTIEKYVVVKHDELEFVADQAIQGFGELVSELQKANKHREQSDKLAAALELLVAELKTALSSSRKVNSLCVPTVNRLSRALHESHERRSQPKSGTKKWFFDVTRQRHKGSTWDEIYKNVKTKYLLKGAPRWESSESLRQSYNRIKKKRPQWVTEALQGFS